MASNGDHDDGHGILNRNHPQSQPRTEQRQGRNYAQQSPLTRDQPTVAITSGQQQFALPPKPSTVMYARSTPAPASAPQSATTTAHSMPTTAPLRPPFPPPIPHPPQSGFHPTLSHHTGQYLPPRQHHYPHHNQHVPPAPWPFHLSSLQQRPSPVAAPDPNLYPLEPIQRFALRSVPFQQPREIGSFSYDEQRQFVMDDSRLAYYHPPDLSTEHCLSYNYEKYIARDPMVDERIDALLDALLCIKDKEEKRRQQQDHSSDTVAAQRMVSSTTADFVSYRGVLTKIMCAPYARNEPWEIRATLFKGSIYLNEHVTQEKRAKALGETDRHKLMSYWGYRFETICTINKPSTELRRKTRTKRRLPSPTFDDANSEHAQCKAKRLKSETSLDGADPDQRHSNGGNDESDRGHARTTVDNADRVSSEHETDEIDPQDPELVERLEGIVNTNIQYCTVARTKVGEHSIILGAEVDCTKQRKKPPPYNPLDDYIELKTSRVITTDRERSSFERHKLLKFWAQSYLAGVPTIIVGFRDDNGIVRELRTFKTCEIPQRVRDRRYWDKKVCISFLEGVLRFIRQHVVEDDPTVSYAIRWEPPYNGVRIERLPRSESFLTERFLSRWHRP